MFCGGAGPEPVPAVVLWLGDPANRDGGPDRHVTGADQTYGVSVFNEPLRVSLSSDASGGSFSADGPEFTVSETLRTRAFWIVASGTGLFGLIQTAVFFSLVPIFLDRGLGETDAVQMLSFFAFSLAAMHLVGGVLADRFAAPLQLAVALALLAASMVILRSMSASWIGCFSGIVLGVAQGLYFGASNPLWARYFGRLHLGKIRGVLMTVNVAMASLGPLLIGVSRDLLGNHDLILALFAVLPVPLILLAIFATPPAKVQAKPAI